MTMLQLFPRFYPLHLGALRMRTSMLEIVFYEGTDCWWPFQKECQLCQSHSRGVAGLGLLPVMRRQAVCPEATQTAFQGVTGSASWPRKTR